MSARVFLCFLLGVSFCAAAFDDRTINLDELVVRSAKRPVLHMMAYMREYSTLSTYNDTVYLFREKYVDFMIPPDDWKKFRGWARPRVLASKSYYRFTDPQGTDSVSEFFPEHFSWSDWVGIYRQQPVPTTLRHRDVGTDTVMGRYSPAIVWQRDSDRMTVDIDLLADTVSRVWAPAIAAFIDGDTGFDCLKLHYILDNFDEDAITARDISVMTFEIESARRGRNLRRLLNTGGSDAYVQTHAEIYMVDKEFLSSKEARAWDKRLVSEAKDIAIVAPPDAPPLPPETLALVQRVDSLDSDAVRIGTDADRRLGSFKPMYYKLQYLNMVKKAFSKLKNLLK